jgi:hypothetical protein
MPAGPGLSTSVDTTYADDAADPSVKQHQQDHDKIAGILNKFDNTVTPAANQGLIFDSGSGTFVAQPLSRYVQMTPSGGSFIPAAYLNDTTNPRLWVSSFDPAAVATVADYDLWVSFT